MAYVIPQIFGGVEIPSAQVSGVCISPEARGAGIAKAILDTLTEDLLSRGVALMSLWTPSVGVYRRWGWEVVGVAQRWSVPIRDLAVLSTEDAIFEAGFHSSVGKLQRNVVNAWNGPIVRPDWWWNREADENLQCYRLVGKDGSADAFVAFKTLPGHPWRYDLLVSEFWAKNMRSARLLYAFLGRTSSQAHMVRFQQGVLPSFPSIVLDVDQFSCQTEAWYPWMTRLIDIPKALSLREWCTAQNSHFEFEILENGRSSIYSLTLDKGKVDVKRGGRTASIQFKSGELPRWYSGALQDLKLPGNPVEAVALAGTGHPSSHSSAWLPDIF